MGCNASGVIINQESLVNIDHKLVHLVSTNQIENLIEFIKIFELDIDINSAINFRGDTLLHYACFKNN
jgi:hypothetical protein